MIEKILIANRGEIAVRVMRTAKEMGIKTVAVYSDQDRDAYHTRFADEAYALGGLTSAESYLNTQAILDVIDKSGAQAVHPGYGFYSENADFARTLIEKGIIWVGPPPSAIESMGDKISAREVAIAADVSFVPGTKEPIKNVNEIIDFGNEHGFPVAIKAAYGGGGRGMRVVYKPEEAAEAFEAASREALAYFGRDEAYLEKYLVKPRHVEVQIFGDHHGNYVYLGTRDCSVQRRHQKLIEEAPAPFISAAIEAQMGEQAIAVAKKCGYTNAGTVEMLYVSETEKSPAKFYFLEMNTRLQVEHCVSEEVTKRDFVAEQIKVACGEPLSFTQNDITITGHSIECRINAENTHTGFTPSPGTISSIKIAQGPGVRFDGGYESGDEVSQYYDNLIGKLIVWAPTRDEAIARLIRAIDETKIEGLHHTLGAQKEMLKHGAFSIGTHHTRWVEDNLDPSLWADESEDEASQASASNNLEPQEFPVEVNGKRFSVKMYLPEMQVSAPKKKQKSSKAKASSGGAASSGSVTAPMQGTIISINCSIGDKVEKGSTLCILEAMKMENQIKAPIDGVIKDLTVSTGDLVGAGDTLVVIEKEGA
ncbi:MAG: biotin carboxylase N-terminal domain-containing protein [Acidimicrobiia bacterium]